MCDFDRLITVITDERHPKRDVTRKGHHSGNLCNPLDDTCKYKVNYYILTFYVRVQSIFP